MTVPSRGARTRRGGRGPGWMLLTALLVLAILASATLVFTNRVEFLRLAVILSLWAAVVAAFVTVIYRRQSEVAQARARDMKFVYDLQLDREITARREYELSVEAHLRRQMRAQAAEEMAALRAELASLRSHLEVMLGTDLGHRPALESERVAVPMPAPPDRVESSRVTMVAEEVITITEETIIDVPEEPLAPEPEAATLPPPPVEPRVREYQGAPWPPAPRPAPRPYAPAPPTPPPPPPAPQPDGPWRPPESRPGRHATAAGAQQRAEAAAADLRGRHSVPAGPGPVPGRHRGPVEAVAPAPEPAAEPPAAEPEAESEGQHSAGQSISDLLSKLNVTGPLGGGGRRRRKD